MRIFVTGGAGYVGCRLVPTLAARGHEVRVLDKMVFGDAGLRAAGEALPEDARRAVTVARGDVRDVAAADLRGFDAVVHLAALSNDPTAEFRPEATFRINVLGTRAVARVAAEAGVDALVLASSCSVYHSDQPSAEDRREAEAVDPRAPYSRSKFLAEQEALEAAMTCSAGATMRVACLRKGTIYGHSRRMRYDLVVNAMVRDAFLRRRIVVHAGGRARRPILSMTAAVAAYVCAVEAPPRREHPPVLNVLSENVTVLELARRVRWILERRFGARVDLEVQEVGPTRSYGADGGLFRASFPEWDSFCVGGLGSPETQLEEAVFAMWGDLEAGRADPDDPTTSNMGWIERLEAFRGLLDEMGGAPL